MPSPVGHALAGLALGHAFAHGDAAARRRALVVAVVAANLPDVDIGAGLAVGDINRFHPSVSHSFGAALAVTLLAALVCRRAAGGALRAALLVGTCYLSHLGLDWLCGPPGRTRNLPLLWPLSDRQYISDWLPFGGFAHGPPGATFGGFLAEVFSPENVAVVGREVLLVGPFALAAWWLARRRAAAFTQP